MARRYTRVWAALAGMLLCVSAAGMAQEGSNRKDDKGVAGGMGNAEEKRPDAVDFTSYVIGEEDVLSVSVWKEPEITRTVPVRPDGKISLPLIHDIQAAGLTPSQLAMAITEKLRKYLAEPQVTVIVTEIRSRRVYIVGEVNRAGAFPMLPGMSVLQALSSAGGFTQFANLKGIYVLRNEKGKQIRFLFNYKEVIKGQRPGQNITLKSGDTIVVP